MSDDTTEFIENDDGFDSTSFDSTGFDDATETTRFVFRPVPFIFAAAFIVVGLVTIGSQPDGFDANAIRLWPIAIFTVGSASLLGLIVHLATRP